MPAPQVPFPILFIDDDPLLLGTLRRNLGREFHIVTCDDALEGLRLASETGPFAVVVSDLKMPGLDGISLLRRVEEPCPDTVRMLLTGYANLETALKAVNEGHVFRILAKPCSMETVRMAVSACLEQYKLLQARQELASLRRLGKALEGIIFALTALVEARDPYTGGHQRRVAELAEVLGRRLRLDPDRVLGLRLAAMVHDVGKVYVPAEFLNKPGPLSEAEFCIIKSHPKIGADILGPIDFPWPIAQAVGQHHERLDGSGYPQGLAGDAILFEARIIGVADVVEAMTFYRPYRRGLGLEAALAEIEKGAGRLYDRDVVRACLEVFREGFSQCWPDSPGAG